MMTIFENFSPGLFIWQLLVFLGFLASIYLIIKLYQHLKDS